jgi:glycopeptide antibiotics resistance protein
MIEISYGQMVLAISVVWFLVRGICALRAGRVDVKRELQLLLVYICIIVVVRFTFCPFGMVDGKIQPLVFDGEKIFPLWVNLVPFVYLFDYPTVKEALLNLIGNVTMFIPLGIVWPAVFKKLDRPWKVIGAGVGVSLVIEIMQLPFFGRSTDIDDLILNSAGYLLGYGLWLLVRRIKTRVSYQ